MKCSRGLWPAFSGIVLPFLPFLHHFADTESACGPVSCLISCLTELSKFSLHTQYVSPAHMPWPAWLSWLSPLEKANKIRLFTTQLPSAHECLFSCCDPRTLWKPTFSYQGDILVLWCSVQMPWCLNMQIRKAGVYHTKRDIFCFIVQKKTTVYRNCYSF